MADDCVSLSLQGRVLDETPEFGSFKRTFIRDWPAISSILKSLEKLMKDYAVATVRLDGKAIAALASRRGPTEISDFVACCVDIDDILKVIRVPKLMFRGPNGKEKAATKIQSNWRRFKCEREYRRLQVMIEKVRLIQQWARLRLAKQRTRDKVRENAENDIEFVGSLRAKLI